MNAVLGKIAATAHKLAQYHSGDGISPPSGMLILSSLDVLSFYWFLVCFLRLLIDLQRMEST